MSELSEVDLRLLGVIAQFLESQGRAPTQAEIAIGLGWQTSSRANVHRLLERLRPTYVDWSEKARSLKLTAAAHAVLAAATTSSNTVAPPLDTVVITLLASGITVMAEHIREGRPAIPYTIPAWRRGVNMLSAALLLRGVESPTDDQNVLAQWCNRSPSQWPVTFPQEDAPFLNEPLLNADFTPSDFCRELAEQVPRGNAEREACEHLMLRILQRARQHDDPVGYTAVRRFVIEYPVIDQLDLISAANRPPLARYGAELHDLYETVPGTVADEGGLVHRCGFCGWTMNWRSGRYMCVGPLCADQARNTTLEPLPLDSVGALLRVREAIRAYVVAPGRHELHLGTALANLGGQVTYWPRFDSYDLRVRWSDGITWAIDVKDWRYAYLLAPHLTPLRDDDELVYHRAFYVVPDIHVERTPAYLDYLRYRTRGQPFTVQTIQGLITAARKEVARA